MTVRLQLPAEVMCANAGFHANQAGQHVGKARLDLAAWPLLPQYDRSALIEPDDVERVLADIDPMVVTVEFDLLDMAVLRLTLAPFQITCW